MAEYTTTERKEPETQETEANLQDNSREDRRNSGSSGDHANGETVTDGESAAAAEIPVTIAEGENRTAEDETGEYLDTNNNGAGDGDTYDDPSANESGDEGNGGDSGSGNGDGSTGGGGGSSNGGSGSGSGGSNGGGTSGSSGSNNSGHGNGSNSGNAGSNGGNSDNGSETIPVTETTARIPVTEITAAVIPTSVRTNLRSRLRLSRTSRWGYTE